MKLHVFFITTLAIIGLVFWLITWALGQAFSQDHPVSKQQPRLFVSLQYMDAEGCANRDKVTNSDSCVQNVQVSEISQTGAKDFVIAIAYTDQTGVRRLQSAIANSEQGANPEEPGISVASTFFTDVDNITDLQATVVADDGSVVTVKN